MFKYTESQKVALGLDENITEKFACYKPVAETLKSFLQSLPSSPNSSDFVFLHNKEILMDVCDGEYFKHHRFFNENPESFKLILYEINLKL